MSVQFLGVLRVPSDTCVTDEVRCWLVLYAYQYGNL